jgi:L-lactate dehydrogenase
MAAVETVLGNHQSVISVSTLMTGQYGFQVICLSLPCVVGVNGVEEILTLTMNAEEERGFRSSTAKLKATLESLQQR